MFFSCLRCIILPVLLLPMLQLYGVNLLTNGDFKEGLLHWKFESRSAVAAVPFASGGPENVPFIRLTGAAGSGSFSRVYVGLPKKERFKVSCYYRLHPSDNPYKAQINILCLPKVHTLPLEGETGKWLKFEKIFTSTNGGNYVSFKLSNAPGTVDIALASVEPLNSNSKSSTALDHSEAALVPVANMHYIPSGREKVKFYWSGKFPAPEPLLDAVFFTADKPNKKIRVPLKKRTAWLDVKQFGALNGSLTALLVHRRTGKTFFRAVYPFRIVECPEQEGAEKLNNLVTQLFNGQMRETLTLNHSRSGWIFVRFIPDGADGKFSVSLNGSEIVNEKSLRYEAVRLCEPGKLKFIHQGDPGKFIVRMIPDIHLFPLGLNDWPGSGIYNWSFAKKYMLPALTTVNSGIPASRDVLEMQSMGLKWFVNHGVPDKKRDELLKHFNERQYDVRGKCDGASFDEMTLSQPGVNDRFANVLRKINNPGNRMQHVWITGTTMPVNSNLFSATFNSAQGKGRLLHEIYKHSLRNEDEAGYSIRMSKSHAVVTRQIIGDRAYQQNYSMIFGLFNDYPSISLASYPEADFKYFLEMLIHAVAVEPEFADLGGVGFWGIHHANEELVRWGFALLRHYAIEGNTDMLSGKYGFTYNPGHVKNPDFEQKLEFWESNGMVSTVNIPKYGNSVQHRYGAPAGVGDHAALLRRTQDEYGELSQEMTGFTPGKVYVLTYITADHNDVKNQKHNPKRQPVTHQLENVEILKNLRIVDRSKAASEKSQKVRLNVCRVIFRANDSRVKLTLNNRKAAAGEETLLNYICVTPYFEKEQ